MVHLQITKNIYKIKQQWGFGMIYENIRNLREDNDKKQQELADYLHIKQTTYSKYELGKINIPIEMIIKLADYYDVSVDYLLGRTVKKG